MGGDRRISLQAIGLEARRRLEAHYNLGKRPATQGKLAEAIAECRTRRSGSSPDDRRSPLATSATPWHPRVSWTRRSPSTAQRSGSSPTSPSTHYNLGIALKRQGKLEEAIAEFRAAIRINPDDAEAHFHLGNALNGQGKLEEAIAEYRR